MIAASDTISARPHATTKERNIRVLLVEDSKSDVYLLQQMLHVASAPGSRYEFVDVPRLTDAFTRIARQHFDIIFLDLNLLDVDGLVAFTTLHAEAPETPIIIYSGLDDPRLKEQALRAGAKSYLVKGRQNGAGLCAAIEETLSHAA